MKIDLRRAIPGKLATLIVGVAIGFVGGTLHGDHLTREQHLSDLKQGFIIGCNMGGGALDFAEQEKNCRDLADQASR